PSLARRHVSQPMHRCGCTRYASHLTTEGSAMRNIRDTLVIEEVPIGDLPPDPKNPRRMTESQARKLMESLETFGAVEPAVFNRTTGETVGGHMRIEAARVLGWDTYPTVFVDLD